MRKLQIVNLNWFKVQGIARRRLRLCAGILLNGHARIDRKRAWSTWAPLRQMIEREPDLEQYTNGMEPGLPNPLGARALYVFEEKVDTLYRLHGTSKIDSIRQAVSGGCIRLLNQDIIDLYQRVPVDSEIVVIVPVSLLEQGALHTHGA